jgi:hypothetical protein
LLLSSMKTAANKRSPNRPVAIGRSAAAIVLDA